MGEEHSLYEQAEEACIYLQNVLDFIPGVALVLGSGLGELAEELDRSTAVRYREIPNAPVTTVEGHAGRLVAGVLEDTPVLCMQGRFHYYEGHPMEKIVFMIRVFGLLGLDSVVLTNAAGGVNEEFEPGDFMCIEDHLNFMGTNPLRGLHDDRFGPRFPDMTKVYDPDLRASLTEVASARDVPLRRGVYAAMCGPSYETPAEIRMLRTVGADAVGMSTVPEAIAARQVGLRVLGISCITNRAAGVGDEVLTHDEVLETSARVARRFKELIRALLPEITEDIWEL